MLQYLMQKRASVTVHILKIRRNCTMARECFTKPTNPYHYALHCISGRWKMVILHEVYTFGKIQFNHTRRVLPITEKVLSQQLKELCEDGMIERKVDETCFPPSVQYVLTKSGEQLLPILDALYIWSIQIGRASCRERV